MIDSFQPTLPTISFVHYFQTKFQKDVFENFALAIVFINSTNKMNHHNFKLTTVLVPDDYGEGYFFNFNTYFHLYTVGQSVAWCISDQEDTQVMELP